MFLLDSRTPSPRFQLAGANGSPEVTHLLADFPYWGFPLSWAPRPRALMRFGTASGPPFHRAARLLLRITLHRLPPEKFLRCSAAVVTVSPLRPNSHDSSRGSLLPRRRITSFLGRTRLADSLKHATTSKICSAHASRHTRAHPSPPCPCQPTTLRVRGLASKVSAIHFPRPAVRWVRCNPFLSGCRLPWPPPHCLNRAHAFSLCPSSGRLSPR